MSNTEIFGVPYLKKGKGIYIKKKNRGKFTEYCGGKVTDKCIQKAKNSKNPKLRKRATFAQNARGWAKKHQEGGSMEPSAYNRAVYSSINPLWGVPDNFFQAVRLAAQAKIKSMGDNPDQMDYEVGNSLGAKVADAGWRKRLGLEYENQYLPVFNGDTVRLPKKLEMEIPTDTIMLKNRIAATEKLMKRSSKYENSDAINLALKSDKRALEALRKTYATGQPVGIDEFSHNSRQLVKNGEIDENFITPLNVFRNYNIRYDKPTNRMYYSKSYDFDTMEHDWDKFVPGNPFYIRGYINLNKKK